MFTSSDDANTSIKIRPATLDDISNVRNLLVASWHDTYDSLLGVERVTEMTNQWHAMDVLAAQAVRPNTSFLVALQNDLVVGHAFAVEQDEHVLLLSRLYILPTQQRQGIGEGLLRAAMQRHPGTKRVQLVVEARNTKALAFYRQHGFVVTGEIEEEEPPPLRMEMIVGD
jgi:ribosomal protein S18 acetylase RimI-like enzyme